MFERFERLIVLSLRSAPASIHFCPYLQPVLDSTSMLEFAISGIQKNAFALGYRFVVFWRSGKKLPTG